MQGIQESTLQAAVSKMPQADYVTSTGVGVAPNQTYIEQILTSKSLVKKTVPTANDKGYANGQRLATESWVDGGHMTDFSMPFDPTFQNIGRYLYAVMGGVTSAAQATLFRHLLKLIDVKISSQLPAYTILTQAAPGSGGLNVKAPSMCAKSLKLSGNGAARCKASVDWIGSGEYVQPSGVDWATNVQSTQGTQTAIYNTIAALTRSDAPGGTNAVSKSLCENIGWELNITNTFDDKNYGCVRLFDPTDVRKGILRSELHLVDTEISSKYKFKMPLNSTEMGLLENQAPLKLLLGLLSTQTLTATSQVMNFDMPLNKYKVLDHSAENGFLYCSIEPETLFSVSANKALEVELINSVQAYA